MKVLMHVSNGHAPSHFERELEIATSHLEQGHDVHIVQCTGDQKVCLWESNPDWRKCMLCRRRSDQGFNLLDIPDENIHVLQLTPYENEVVVPHFENIEELKQYSIDGVDHGLAAASTIISELREPCPDPFANRDLVERCLYTSISLYYAMLDYIKQIDPDLVYFANGRASWNKPVARAAEAKGVRRIAHDVSHQWNKYLKIEGTTVHDLEVCKRSIEEMWREGRDGRIEKGKRFFHNRRYGKSEDIDSKYTSSQELGKLPSRFDRSRINVAIFNSSEDEYAALENYQNPLYVDQMDGLEKMVMSGSVTENVFFYLRVHPNLSDIRNSQTNRIQKLKDLSLDNLCVIDANDNIDSYALLEACDKTVTFGSTMGIESVFYGTPSILIGKKFLSMKM